MTQGQKWQEQGDEPDYRFSLANERTFLPWVRTALAILAGAILLHEFASHIQPAALIAGASVALALLAALLGAGAYQRWKASEIAMRRFPPAAVYKALAGLVSLHSGAVGKRSDRARTPVTRTGDQGLQAQRTALAWGPTALAMIVNSLLVLRLGVNAADRPVEFLGLGFLAISGGLLLIGERRRRQLVKTPARASLRLMAGCAIGVVLVSLAAVMAMLR